MAERISWNTPRIVYQPLREVEEVRDVLLVTSAPAWDAVRENLRLKVAARFDVSEATEAHWQTASQAGEVVYAVGGGLAVDAAKYLAARRGLPLVCVPTVLSVDAFFTWASGIRAGGCVRYVVTRPPDWLVVDYEIIAQAPSSVRAAGICDVLSIATGCWDWQYAEEQGRNPASMPYRADVARVAQSIMASMLDGAEAAGRGEPEGLQILLDCLIYEVILCNQIGHSRPEEGSEHYFAYSVENVMGKGLPHGDLVGPGILLLAALQGQDIQSLKRALKACQIPLQNIPSGVIRQTLADLPAYSHQHELPYSIAHEPLADPGDLSALLG